MINDTFQETGESIFSTISRLARQHDAVNLGQGFPDFPPPKQLRERLSNRIDGSFDEHQYAPSPGIPELRQRIADLYHRRHDLSFDPDREVTITTGATEALSATLYGLLNPGDEVIVLDPVYDLYEPVARRAGASVTSIPLMEPGFEMPVKRLKREVSCDTDLIILNNPHNPTGRVFTEPELQEIAHVAEAHDLTILSDEVYGELTYGDSEYRPMAGFDGAQDRTLTVGSVGKLLNATGWKIGWVLAPESLTRATRVSHQFTTFSTATPLQATVVEYLNDGGVDAFLDQNREDYVRRRQVLLEGLEASPFKMVEPEGTYFTVARIPDDRLPGGENPDLELAKRMIEEDGLATIPLSSFYVGHQPEHYYLRFAFCKKETVLEEARRILASLN